MEEIENGEEWLTPDQRWTGKVTINGTQILNILMDFYFKPHSNFWNLDENRTRIPLTYFIENTINNQLPDDLSLEDRKTYIGVFASLIWMNREDYLSNLPREIMIYQRPNGCFKTKISRFN